MFALILTVILAIVAVIGISVAIGGSRKIRTAQSTRAKDEGRGQRLFGGIMVAVGLVGALISLGTSTIYSQSVGEARVIVNVDGTIAGENLDPGLGFKAPWQSTVDFDLFAQQATYAGNGEDGTPSYTGGEVNGLEITSAVSGGAQANFDLSVTYTLNAENVQEIYKTYRSQERFTSQIVNQQILAITRDVPSAYTPVEFRGTKRGEATTNIQERLNEALNKYGVDVSVVNLQNIRYTDEVEASIKNVEVAQQNEEKAEADLRATEVSAQAQVVEATAEAEANRLRAESITPELIEANRVEALREAAKNGSLIVVPDGSSPLIQVPQQ